MPKKLTTTHFLRFFLFFFIDQSRRYKFVCWHNQLPYDDQQLVDNHCAFALVVDLVVVDVTAAVVLFAEATLYLG